MTMEIISKGLYSTGRYLVTVIPVMAVSIYIMNMLQNSGLIRRISWVSRPLVKFGHLKEPMGITFITSFGSPSAANAMLKGLYDKGSISQRELMISVLANAFPVMVMEMRSMLPVIVSLLGETGVFIFCLLLLLRFIQTIIVLFAGRLLLPGDGDLDKNAIPEMVLYRGKALLKQSLRDTIPSIKRIILITTPVTVVTFILLEAGVFSALSDKIQFFGKLFPVPMEGMGIIAAYFGHYVAGYTMAGNLLSSHTLTVKETVLTLLTAKVLTSILFAIRHSTPYYIGIFGSRLGTQIMLASTMLRNVINIAAIFILYFIW
jgi:hypothetical protein